MKSLKHIFLTIGVFLIILVGCRVSYQTWFGGTQLLYPHNELYSKYREGVIKRHIGSNGRYHEAIWLRTKDAVDFGQISWPGADHVPSVNDNVRESRVSDDCLPH